MSEILELIKYVEKETRNLHEKYEVTVMSNSRSKTRRINGQNIEYTDQNEFFSDIEFTEIHTGIQDAGFYTNASFNELSLMKSILDKSYYENNQIIYNLSRNGRHPGKKSMMPAFLDLLNIPYTGSNAFVISLCREKYTYAKYLQTHGIKVPESYIYLGKEQWFNDQKITSQGEYIVKPIHESASIGLSQNSIFTVGKELEKDLDIALSQITSPVLIQQFIDGYECEVPLFVSETGAITAFEPVGVSIDNVEYLKSNILTYERSFNDNYEFYDLHNQIGTPRSKKIQLLALQVAKLMGISQYGRIDFRIDNKGVAYLIDIAASPYTTKHSSFAHAFEKLNLPYEKIYSTIIGLCFLNFKSKLK